jgi:hypothetical protein
MGTANKKLVEQHFYGLIVGDGVLVRVPSHGILLPLFSSSFYRLALSQFDDVAVCVVKWVTDLTGRIRGMRSRNCQDIRVANLARLCWWFWVRGRDFSHFQRHRSDCSRLSAVMSSG